MSMPPLLFHSQQRDSATSQPHMNAKNADYVEVKWDSLLAWLLVLFTFLSVWYQAAAAWLQNHRQDVSDMNMTMCRVIVWRVGPLLSSLICHLYKNCWSQHTPCFLSPGNNSNKISSHNLSPYLTINGRYMYNRSSNPLQTWWVYFWGQEGAQCRVWSGWDERFSRNMHSAFSRVGWLDKYIACL